MTGAESPHSAEKENFSLFTDQELRIFLDECSEKFKKVLALGDKNEAMTFLKKIKNAEEEEILREKIKESGKKLEKTNNGDIDSAEKTAKELHGKPATPGNIKKMVEISGKSSVLTGGIGERTLFFYKKTKRHSKSRKSK